MKNNVRKPVKFSSAYPHYRRRYPNEAEPQYFIDRLVDVVLAVAAGMGSLTIFIFLITV